jgi:hypothetical protein
MVGSWLALLREAGYALAELGEPLPRDVPAPFLAADRRAGPSGWPIGAGHPSYPAPQPGAEHGSGWSHQKIRALAHIGGAAWRERPADRGWRPARLGGCREARGCSARRTLTILALPLEDSGNIGPTQHRFIIILGMYTT